MRLTSAHISAQAALRSNATRAVELLWDSLPAYNRPDVDVWLERVLPVIAATQRQSVTITEAYLASALERPPIGVDAAELVGSAVRAGTDPSEVYSRPFVHIWTALGEGVSYNDAVAAGLAQAKGSAAMDVQLSARATFEAVQQADDGIYGYQRVADGGACDFCQMIDGAYVKSADAMALHNNCGCSLEPLTAPHPRVAKLPSGVAVHDHGELGAVLTSPEHSFTGPSGLT